MHKSLAKMLELEQHVPNDSLKGLLLYCGPYDIQKLETKRDNKILRFLLNRVGWGYIGERN